MMLLQAATAAQVGLNSDTSRLLGYGSTSHIGLFILEKCYYF